MKEKIENRIKELEGEKLKAYAVLNSIEGALFELKELLKDKEDIKKD